jgi:hypothetical protein
MLRYVSLICFSVLFILPAQASETRFECPPQIHTNQSVSGKTPDGWSAARETRYPQSLKAIDVFDGLPQEHADLVPDDEQNQDPSKAIWTFEKKKENSIWFACAYSGTDVLLTKELPRDITQCRPILTKGRSSDYIVLVCK